MRSLEVIQILLLFVYYGVKFATRVMSASQRRRLDVAGQADDAAMLNIQTGITILQGA